MAILFALALPADLQPQQTAPGAAGLGSGVTAPTVLFKVEPEYSDEARDAKFQGTVVLYLEVDADGMPRNIKVLRRLGLGLDEKAIEAVEKWRFRPGYKDGKPVTMACTIEVNFRLLDQDKDYVRGLRYYTGNGEKKNYGKALKSFRVAAKRRDADAQRMLGIMYAEGQGVGQDYVLAYMWLDLSANGGNLQAREARNKLEKKLTPDQIAKGQRLAREWK